VLMRHVSTVRVVPPRQCRARLLRLLRARLAAPGSSALPGRGRPTGRQATASGVRASRVQSRQCYRLRASRHVDHTDPSDVSVSVRREGAAACSVGPVRVPAGLRLAAVGSRALGSGRAEHPRLGAPSRVCTAAHQAAWEDQQEEARPRGMGMGAAGGGAMPLSDGSPPAGWADRATRPRGARCAAREPLLGCTPPSRRQSRRSHCTAHGH
jgi:hypothetical protein